jgi:iron complex outermembrane receptor protein
MRTDYGAHGLRRYQGALGGRVGSTSYTLDASRLLFDGYRQWNTATNTHAGFRVNRGSDRRAMSFTGNWVDYNAKNPGGLSSTLLRANRDTVSPTNFNNKTGEQGRQGQVGATWREQLGAIELQVSAHALQRHIDNPIPFTIVVIDRDAGGARLALSGEPRIAGRTLRLSAGTETQLQRDNRLNFVSNGGTRGADTLDQLERVNNSALFTQVAIDLTPRLLALVGAR